MAAYPPGADVLVPSLLPRWATPTYVRELWETAGRAWITTNMGLAYSGGEWSIDDPWQYDPDNVGPRAYTAQLALTPATQLAILHDADLLDELCQLWTTYQDRLYTVDEIKALGSHDLDAAGDGSAKTLPWKSGGTYQEALLHQMQGFGPACRLLRHVASVADRSSAMQTFADAWAPILMTDQIYRSLCVAENGQFGTEPWSQIRSARWAELYPKPAPTDPEYLTAFVDTDCLALLNAAECLAAYALDPTIYAWPAPERDAVRSAIETGLLIMQDRRTQTQDGDCYFLGEFTSRPGHAYSAETGPENPFGSENRAEVTGWDVSHFYRVPLVLRGLAEVRPTIGTDWPHDRDLAELGRYLYARCYNQNHEAPLFSNYVNGVDGWYRVDDESTGYPPSALADTQGTANQRSLFAGSMSGYPVLAKYSAGVRRWVEDYARLAGPGGDVAHRDRYCHYDSTEFDRDQHPIALLFLLGCCPELLR